MFSRGFIIGLPNGSYAAIISPPTLFPVNALPHDGFLVKPDPSPSLIRDESNLKERGTTNLFLWIRRKSWKPWNRAEWNQTRASDLLILDDIRNSQQRMVTIRADWKCFSSGLDKISWNLTNPEAQTKTYETRAPANAWPVAILLVFVSKYGAAQPMRLKSYHWLRIESCEARVGWLTTQTWGI
jgi:hypothetical protein